MTRSCPARRAALIATLAAAALASGPATARALAVPARGPARTGTTPPAHPHARLALRAVPVPAALVRAVRGAAGSVAGAAKQARGAAKPAAGDVAQTAAADSTPTIYLLTFGPGDAVWERFGHTAIWVHDPRTHTDVAYNWGMFSFQAPHFWSRFLLGTMEYWMQGFNTEPFISEYVHYNRSVWAQELNFTPAQAGAMEAFLEWNALPQNRFYRYDYYRDNCTTRARDAIDRIIGGAIQQQLSKVPSGTTYRSHSLELTALEPLIYTGIDLGLGEPTDRDISVYEEMFLPMQLMKHIAKVTVPGPGGTRAPLVRADHTVFRADRPPLPTLPSERWPDYLLLGAVLGLLMAASGAATRHGPGARLAFATLTAAWSLVAGLLGVTIDFLWIFTRHWAAYHNENVLQVSPLSLALVVLLPLALLGKRRAANTTLALAWIIAGLSILGFLLQALPAWDQVNGDIIALFLPAHIGLAVGLTLATPRPRPRPAASPAEHAHAAL